MAIRYTENPSAWDDVEFTVLRERVDELLPVPGTYTVRDLYGIASLPAPPTSFATAPIPRSRVLILTTALGDFLIDTDGQDKAAKVAIIDDDY